MSNFKKSTIAIEDTQDDETFIEDTNPNRVLLDNDSDFVNEKDGGEEVKQNNKRERENKDGKLRSKYWKYFDIVYIEDDDGVRRKTAKCKFCSAVLKADPIKNGTTGLKKHSTSCKKNPENILKKQNTLQFKKEANGEGSISAWKHDENRIKKALLNLFVVAELPFKFVENEAFIEYTSALNGKVSLPSRHKVSRDVGKYYIEERNKMSAYLSSPTTVVHLTTDTWTSSCQRVNYMVVTAHFIDDDWVMHKRIINLRPIDSHKGEDVGRELLDCIHSWGIKNVMSMTVDNATSNDKAIEFLIKKLPNMYDGGKHFQIRCMTHILNLIVKDGLKENSYHVECVQKAVRYVRHSTQRITKFKKCMKECGVESKKFLCGDCPTRWNSTHDLLKIAVALEEVFIKYELEDVSFGRDLGRVPEHSDFKVCIDVVNFLEKFKTKTELISASSKPLAHLFLREILDVDKHLREWETQVDFCLLGTEMRQKYDKYWGDFEKLNEFMYFAVLLDPTMKSAFIEHAFRKMVMYKNISEEMVEMKVRSLVKVVENKMEILFKMYKEKFDKFGFHEASQEVSNEDVVGGRDVGNDFLGEFLNVEGNNPVAMENELKRYLNEPKAPYTNGFDILHWWKQNALRFPIVSRMAKDILAIQISTVASESAFSTTGRVLDPYRTSLATPIVEALVCTQDWVRKSRKPIVDDVQDILNDDDIAIEIEEALRDYNGKGKGKMSIDP
ncbi:hypothetical protein OSB04_011654 [Centaurea solstitialis]|uniref:BED-type domain-containing protein n=1 Tax=Centaurea solstitialis TaxID=347529 RepID=A0AA38T9V0_9ASTR|nr:hypothetical protein OSB04_011654 [Centaurea solstitialis]